MTFPPVFAAIMTLWPVIAFAGGQGFSSMLALACIPGLAYARTGGRYILAAGAVLLLVIWVSASAIWSPVDGGLVSGSFADETFAVNAAGLRLLLTVLAGIIVLAALNRRTFMPAPEARAWILAAFCVQGIVIFFMALFTDQALTLFDPLSDKDTEAMQNLVRNANAFALALPALAASLIFSRAPRALVVAALIALGAASIWMFMDVGAQTAVIAPLAGLAAAALVWAFRQSGFRVLFGSLAAYVLAAPLIFQGIVAGQNQFGLPLPDSFQSRIWSWEAVGEKIGSAPWLGHGLEAADTWRETYADHPEKLAQVEPFWANYPIVPGHAHNMPLQIWSEAGFVGAALAALALIIIGLRLPMPADMTARARYAAAGSVGAATVAFSVSYSAWNEAFWASLVLIAGSVMLLARPEAPGED